MAILTIDNQQKAWYNVGMDIYTSCSFCGKPIVRRAQAKSRNVKLHFCDMSCKAQYQKLAKPVTMEWLEEHYINQGLDCVQIGRMVNRDPKSVWNWLKDFGIPTRPRGGNIPPHGSGEYNPFYGKKHTSETKEKIRSARLKDGRIPSTKDGVHWMKHDDYSPEDHPSWRGGITPERQDLYSSEEWVEAVKAVWQRDNATCQRCGKHHNNAESRGTFHIHHIVSFMVEELRADPDNLVLLCKNCHLFIHSKSNVNREFLKEE